MLFGAVVVVVGFRVEGSRGGSSNRAPRGGGGVFVSRALRAHKASDHHSAHAAQHAQPHTTHPRPPTPTLKWFMIIALRLGVGLKSEQLTMSTPTWRGCTPALPSASSTALNATCSNSQRASLMLMLGGVTDRPFCGGWLAVV